MLVALLEAQNPMGGIALSDVKVTCCLEIMSSCLRHAHHVRHAWSVGNFKYSQCVLTHTINDVHVTLF